MSDTPAAPAAAPVAPAAPAAPVAAPTPAPASVHLEAPAEPSPKPASAPAVTEPTAEPSAPTVVTYDPTGDTGLDIALGFVGKLGISLDDPAMQATATGDFSLIKAKLATMGPAAQGWEQMVTLAEEAHQRFETEATANATAVANAVHETVGGAETWATINAWASANATAEEKAAINAMFDAGPLQARAAAQMLAGLYAKAAGTTITPNPTTRDVPANTANQHAPLNRRQFVAEVDALARRIGSQNLNTSPEYAALVARRQAFSN